jgi:hypothetical protein
MLGTDTGLLQGLDQDTKNKVMYDMPGHFFSNINSFPVKPRFGWPFFFARVHIYQNPRKKSHQPDIDAS